MSQIGQILMVWLTPTQNKNGSATTLDERHGGKWSFWYKKVSEKTHSAIKYLDVITLSLGNRTIIILN